MVNKKGIVRAMVASVSKVMVKMSNGTASVHYTYQPKRPVGLKKDK